MRTNQEKPARLEVQGQSGRVETKVRPFVQRSQPDEEAKQCKRGKEKEKKREDSYLNEQQLQLASPDMDVGWSADVGVESNWTKWVRTSQSRNNKENDCDNNKKESEQTKEQMAAPKEQRAKE